MGIRTVRSPHVMGKAFSMPLRRAPTPPESGQRALWARMILAALRAPNPPEAIEVNKKSTLADASCSGPRGIRTPGLLNAIETRSQLRYGPIFLRYQPQVMRFQMRLVRIIFVKFTRSAPAGCPSNASRLMMDLEGFEPSASSVRLKRAPNCATGPLPNSGRSFHANTTRFQSAQILTDSI